MRSYLIVLILFIFSTSYAQEINPKGQFLADSIKIGEPVGFSLSLKYPKDLDILFPDSLYNFAPYELEKKTFSPTKTNGEFSYDSAVYYLSSFEIDSVQYLKLPVFVLHGNDSSAVYTKEDSVILKHLVEEIPDSVSAEAAPLIENTNYINVPLQFNYPYFIIGIILLVLITIIVIVIFGGRIKRYFILKKLKKNHEKFLTRLKELKKRQNQPIGQLAESILMLWKKYMEKLESRPYTKLTTKEVLSRYENVADVADSLRGIDKTIYSGKLDSYLEDHYSNLEQFAVEHYKQKVEEVKHG